MLMEKEAAAEYGIKAVFSKIGCIVGDLGFYAEFNSASEKQAFLKVIEGMFIPTSVWAA